MQNVNWWLMALAFLLGLILTLFLLIRRVKREVPVYASLAGGADDTATLRSPKMRRRRRRRRRRDGEGAQVGCRRGR